MAKLGIQAEEDNLEDKDKDDGEPEFLPPDEFGDGSQLQIPP